MDDDIVTRLRNWGRARSGSGNRCEEMHKEAAVEIERLRAERDAERALADQLARALCIAVPWRCCDESRFRRCDCAPDDARIPEHEADAAVLAAYKEARRG